MKKFVVLGLCVAVALVVLHFNNNVPVVVEPDVPPVAVEPNPDPVPDPSPIIIENANEAGRFPVFMYHRIAPSEGNWTRSIDNFRHDLEELKNRGYTLVNLNDFYDGTAQIPPGRTPAVLTFDDSTQGQFNYLVNSDGEISIDPDCAVGMLLEAREKWPELGLAGTFYINANPFGQHQYWREKLVHLVELGFEIGNHTFSHPHLNQLSAEKVQEEMIKMQSQVWEAIPGYNIRSLALPYGEAPKDRSLAYSGTWNQMTYKHDFILEVGSDPAFPPLHVRSNPLSIPRIAVTDASLTRWLDWLDQPLRRYISDGDPTSISVPDELQDQIKKAP